jgi:hypothetical protein
MEASTDIEDLSSIIGIKCICNFGFSISIKDSIEYYCTQNGNKKSIKGKINQVFLRFDRFAACTFSCCKRSWSIFAVRLTLFLLFSTLRCLLLAQVSFIDPSIATNLIAS